MDYATNVQDGALQVNGIEIGEQVRELQDRVDQLVRSAGLVDSTIEMPSEITGHIRPILQLRARRRLVFGDSLFGEPAWEMLLELYDAKSRGRRECVSGLCIASGVPATTALRWIGYLESEGWLTRVPDPKDGRRSFVEATEKTIEAVNRVFRKSDGLPTWQPVVRNLPNESLSS